jgi:formyl-CoA transferase/CoA:oxalate CoA-transferase
MAALAQRIILSPPGDPFAPFFVASNRNKRSITLDLRHPAALDVMGDLVSVSDVVIENFGRRARSTLPINEDWAWKLRPELIWASLTMYGRTGPESTRDGLDLLAQARGGLLSLSGAVDGPTLNTGNSAGDYAAGLHMTVGILAALQQRELTGRGQLVDVALLDSVVACLDGFPLWHSRRGVVPRRSGNNHPAGLPAYGVFPCIDGYIAITASAGSLVRFLEDVLLRPDLCDVPLAGSPAYQDHCDAIDAAISVWTSAHSLAAVEAELATALVPHERVREVDELWSDPQLQARGMVTDLDEISSTDDPGRTIGSPLHLSDSPIDVRYPIPEPGEHNDEILRGLLGYREDHVTRLVTDGALWGPTS